MFKNQDLQMFGLKFGKYDYFSQLEVVDRGSETQLQVGENIYIVNFGATRVNYDSTVYY